ncbi:MAG: hypothetical protein RL582_1366, partial [Bacteroidota bacterium]
KESGQMDFTRVVRDRKRPKERSIIFNKIEIPLYAPRLEP